MINTRLFSARNLIIVVIVVIVIHHFARGWFKSAGSDKSTFA